MIHSSRSTLFGQLGGRGVRRCVASRAKRLLLPAVVVAVTASCGAEPGDELSASRLVIAIPLDGGPVNPYSGSGDFLLGFVFDRLFEPSPHVEQAWPGLAIAAEQIDATTWDVRLRGGVRWHDGTPFTAEDVSFTYRYYRDGPPNRFGHHVSDVPRIDDVVVVDSLTVRFLCGYPCPTLERITLADLPIIPKHVWEGVTSPRTLERLPVGTGPYILEEYRPDELYRFRANPEYALGTPAFDELVMPILSDVSSAFIALRTGQVDVVARSVPPELVAEFAATDGLAVMQSPALTIVELRPNFRRPPFDDVNLRRALSLAVDRAELVERALIGYGRPGVRGYPHPDSPWTNPQSSTPSDAHAARRLLDAEGYVDRDGDGVRETPAGAALDVTILVDAGDATRVRAAELVARQLGRVGFRARPVPLESGALSQRSGARDYDLFVGESGPHGGADPDQFVMSHRIGYLWEWDMRYPELEALIADWMAAETVATRTDAAHAIQDLFNSRPTSVALYYPDEQWAYRPAAWDGWFPLPGQGVVHKWSLVQSDFAVRPEPER